MFKLLIGLKEKGSFQTSGEAVGAFMAKIREIVKEQGGVSLMWLEVSNFIEHDVFVPAQNKTVKCALNFSDTRDIAHRLGIMKEGHVVENPPDVSPLLIDMIFFTVFTKSMEEIMERFDDIRIRFAKESDSPDNDSQIVYEAKIIKS